MDKIGKALQKLSSKERESIRRILDELQKGKTERLDIKKLKSREDIFRVRKGNIRIIYRRDENGVIFVLAIERRSEKTYRRF